MKVLVACEYSGRVREAFIKRGHEAISCDLYPTWQGNGPHIVGDVFQFLKEFPIDFDLMIAHPPCTYLTVSAEWAYTDGPYHQKIKPDTLVGKERREARGKALQFIKDLWDLPIPKKCIENPVGVINSKLKEMPKPQYIHPYQFGEDASKKTGLWLDGLPQLEPTIYVEPRIVNGKKRWGNQTDSGQNKLSPSKMRWMERSVTPQGLADAMAEQWG